jgi:HNH endonuclease
MERPFLNARFYETYNFAFAVRNILHDQFSYIRYLHDFYGDDNYLAFTNPFPRYSALHCFLEFVIDAIVASNNEDVDLKARKQLIKKFKGTPSALEDMQPMVLPIEEAMAYHNLRHQSFAEWLSEQGKSFQQADDDDVGDYLCELRLSGPFDDLLRQSVREAFYVLFGNRKILMLFNEMMASRIAEFEIEGSDKDVAANFEKDGVLKRHHIPTWVQRGVFYRDRGLCVACHRDLSGLVNIWSQDHFDHIVPLRSGGINDVTNIQLLCSECNLKKSGRRIVTSEFYEDWYPLDEIDRP